MKIEIYGNEKRNLIKVIKKKYSQNFEILNRQSKLKPDIIVCYGGDGTLLVAERTEPGIPKVIIRNSQICDKCRDESRDAILRLLSENKFYFSKHYKIEAIFKQKKIVGLNDVIIAHARFNTALRFRVYIDGLPYGGEFLGDGIVVATPIGSTAYYQAITRSNFQEGIGLAFNNTVNSIGHIVLNEKTKIRIKITRGPGMLMFDNDLKRIYLKEQDEIFIQRSNQVANLVDFYSPYRELNIDISKNRLPLGYCQVCRKHYRN
ncbi:MAG: hypothetical protein V1898_04660 [Patescibacteria group bacterium]